MKPTYLCKTLLFITFSFFLLNCDGSGEKASIQNYQAKPVLNSKPNFPGPIILFGDSIAKGTGASSDDFSLKGCLKNVAKENILVQATEGETTTSALNKTRTISSLNPSAIVVSLGSNDVLRDLDKRGSFSKTKTFNNLRTIYRSLVKTKALVVHLGIAPPFKDAKRLPEIEKIARQEGVLFINKSMNGLWNRDEYLSDPVHPNNLGYSVMCGRLLNKMRNHYKF